MMLRLFLIAFFAATTAFSQVPPIEPGVSQELAKWRAARYSDVHYKLDLTLEKMSPVLKGTIEIRVTVNTAPGEQGTVPWGMPIVLDWRRIRGSESLSTVANASVNDVKVTQLQEAGRILDEAEPVFENRSEHLIFLDAVKPGENVIKLDFTSPILTSGSAITRYIDKEDGSEYIYSLFVPSDASTAFPVFDQPDLKARFTLSLNTPYLWEAVSNTDGKTKSLVQDVKARSENDPLGFDSTRNVTQFDETQPISSYVFAFAAGSFKVFSESDTSKELTTFRSVRQKEKTQWVGKHTSVIGLSYAKEGTQIFVRQSQAAKFQPHAAEVLRLNREAIKYFEQYFDYKFPFPKYDLVLIPEFPFGGMEHAGATFLRESSIIFPQEPTRNDHISRALLMFHEASHQWFGDTVTMRWFDDLWLKEGFATFTAYKAMEKIMPEMNAWKVFYERVKQAAYQTDSTKGTTAIYQPIANLSSAKSAYGNIVYNKAPAFLRQAEFYLGEDKFQTAVRAFLKKNEFGNAGWEDLVKDFQQSSGRDLRVWADTWIRQSGVAKVRISREALNFVTAKEYTPRGSPRFWLIKFRLFYTYPDGSIEKLTETLDVSDKPPTEGSDASLGVTGFTLINNNRSKDLIFPNYEDYGYGTFLLDDKSREYVLKNIQNEKDPFLRSMMWGALWDSVREAELDPKVYVELAIKNLPTETDETIVSSILGRVGTAMNYYIESPSASKMLAAPVEKVLIERMQNAATAGQRITFYRAFLNVAASEDSRKVLRDVLNLKFEIKDLKLKTKDKFDIVTRLLILGDPDAPSLLTELEKIETSDDAKRYAYAARAGIATAENKARYWNDFTNNKEISESWIEAAFGPWNSIRHSELTLPYLERALRELPNHKRSRKIFFVNGWLAAFIGGQRSEQALGIVNKFLADNPNLDNDLRLKILENVDVIERAVKIRKKYGRE